jgi:hypothetical protein
MKSISIDEFTEYLFRVPAAARLASLVGLQSDMQMVVRYCERMIERYAGKHLAKTPFDIVGFTTHVDFVDWEALSTAASVAYSRCFLSGVRQALNADELGPSFRLLHDFVLALRNKHIAHSVNSFEQNCVTVHVSSRFLSPAEIDTVTPSHQRQTGISFDIPVKLKALAEWWLDRVAHEIAHEQKVVLQFARATPLSEIRAQDTVKSTSAVDRSANVGKRRQHP